MKNAATEIEGNESNDFRSRNIFVERRPEDAVGYDWSITSFHRNYAIFVHLLSMSIHHKDRGRINFHSFLTLSCSPGRSSFHFAVMDVRRKCFSQAVRWLPTVCIKRRAGKKGLAVARHRMDGDFVGKYSRKQSDLQIVCGRGNPLEIALFCGHSGIISLRSVSLWSNWSIMLNWGIRSFKETI